MIQFQNGSQDGFLASDGLYFGEGPVNILFNDAIAAPALSSATALMQYLTEKV